MLADDLRAIADLLTTRAIDGESAAVVGMHLDAARAALEDDEPTGRRPHDQVGPLRGTDNVVAPPLRFGTPVDRSGTLVVNAVAHCSARYEGPPGLVHGGIVAACFDEVLAVAQRDAGIGGLTRELTVRFRRPIPLDEPLVFTGWIESDDGRRARARGACHVGDELHADADAEFARPRA